MRLDGISVLVVDDDGDNAEIFALVLAGEGAIVRTATSGRKALDILAQWSPHVLLLDIVMPEMDGFDLLVAVQQRSSLRDTAVAAVSGLASAAERERAFSAGFAAYVTKPFGANALIDLVEWLATPGPRGVKAPSSAVSLP